MSEPLSKRPRLSTTSHPRSVRFPGADHAISLSNHSSVRLSPAERTSRTCTHGDLSHTGAVRIRQLSPITSSSVASESRPRASLAETQQDNAKRFGQCTSPAAQCAHCILPRLRLETCHSSSYLRTLAPLLSQPDGALGVFDSRVDHMCPTPSDSNSAQPNVNRWDDVLADRPSTPGTGACRSRPGLVPFGVSAPPTSSSTCPRLHLAVNQTEPGKRPVTQLMRCTDTHVQ